MPLRLTIPRNETGYLAVLRDAGRESLQQLKQVLTKAGPLAEHAEFVEQVGSVVDPTKASATATALLRLAQVRRHNHTSASELVDAVTAELVRQRGTSRWSSEDLEKWQSVASDIAELLAVESVVVLEKVLELSYAFSQLFSSARVLTDVRPVFNEDGNAMRAAVVTNTLEISYTEEGQAKTIRLALDGEDLRQVVRACERARLKTQTLREGLLNGLPNVVAGVDDGE